MAKYLTENLVFGMSYIINHHWFKKWIDADAAPSHFLNQW